MKKTICILLSLMLAVTGLVGLGMTSSAVYKVGSTYTFGSYPQTDVTASLGTTLNAMSGAWTSSGYCLYKDVVYNGKKYRGVTFDSYRPIFTGDSSSYSVQQDNGYTKGNIYWFRYDPLVWRVLDPAAGLLLCDAIIDSQSICNRRLYQADGYSWGDSTKTYYACNYAKSDIRNWLNNDFYNTAFSATEKAAIQTTALSNNSALSSDYDAPATNDKVFSLSIDEATNSAYGFRPDVETCDMVKLKEGTDYAKCQGLWVCRNYESVYSEFSFWWLRTPWSSSYVSIVENDGHITTYGIANQTDIGVCPAIRIGDLNAGITVNSIAVKTMPAKIMYTVGDAFDDSGLTLTATYSDGSTETITSGFTCTGFTSAAPGTVTVTVTYGGKTATFYVTIGSSSGTLTGITIKSKPSKTVYTYRNDKNLDLSGLEVEATYSDNSTSLIDPAACTISGYSAKPAGAKTITVEYGGKTAQFDVTVKYVWWQWLIRIFLLGFIWY